MERFATAQIRLETVSGQYLTILNLETSPGIIRVSATLRRLVKYYVDQKVLFLESMVLIALERKGLLRWNAKGYCVGT